MVQNFTPEGWVDNTGKDGKLDLPEGKFLKFTVLEEIRRPQTNLPTKIIYLQKVMFEDKRIELRLCYYMFRNGGWKFGRFATLLPESDFKAITEEAWKRNWI
jgi:hypothetical protein